MTYYKLYWFANELFERLRIKVNLFIYLDSIFGINSIAKGL
jgi:hypothetical protein